MKARFLALITVTLLITVHISQGATLAAQWLLDGNANDSQGFSNGVATNLQWVSTAIGGQSRTVAYFNGSSGVTVNETPQIHPGSAFTLTAWVSVATWSGKGVNTGHAIFDAGGVVGISESSYATGITEWTSDFNFSGANDYPTNSQFVFSRSSDPMTTIPSVSTLGVDPNEWHLFSWTYDGQISKAYLDGVLLNPNTYIANNATDISPYTGFGSLRIGYSHGGLGSADSMNGYLSDLRLYNGALSGTEIQQLYNAIPEPSTPLLALLLALGAFRRRVSR